MKRSIILFLLAFVVTSIGMGTYYYLKNRVEAPTTSADNGNKPVATDTTPATTPPTVQPQETTTPDTPTQTEQDHNTPGPVVTPDETIPGLDTTDDTPDAPEELPESDKPVTLPADVKPNNPAHEAALLAVEHFKTENPEESITKLVEGKKMSPEAADVIKEWLKSNTPAGVEEIGDTRNYAEGTKTYRYRITTESGENDLLIDVQTDRKGQNPFIVSAMSTPSDRTILHASSDAMTVAEAFIQAVREGNMNKARSMVNNSGVSAATLAGLCMIFEEGTFVLSNKTPIRNTAITPVVATYLIYVVPSDTPDAPTIEANHIAMTLHRLDERWQVTAVGTNKLLDIYLMGAQKEGGRYFPIVKNPKGGESLALYFDFNDAALTPRSERQLQIVADILRESNGKLDIAGHTDDVGSEEYNLQLSQRRAESVREVLIRYGVAPEQITTKGLGKNEPRQLISETDDEQQLDIKRGENRRAEIYLDFAS